VPIPIILKYMKKLIKITSLENFQDIGVIEEGQQSRLGPDVRKKLVVYSLPNKPVINNHYSLNRVISPFPKEGLYAIYKEYNGISFIRPLY
jgi:hypothetical protein